MIRISPRNMILIGILLMITGWVMAALLVMKVLESTFLTNFLAFTASNLGLFLGIAGLGMVVDVRRKAKRDEDDPYTK